MGISVVIPLYNKANEVARAIMSVHRQEFPASEIIVVDDGSTDGSGEIVRRLAIPSVQLIQQENHGECGARNRGIVESKEEIIAFLDADDFWDAAYLQTIAQLVQEYPVCGVFGTAWQFMDKHGRIVLPRFYRVPPVGQMGIIDSYYETAAWGLAVNLSAVAVRRPAFELCGMFPQGVKRGGDRETLVRLAARFRVAFCNRVLSTVCLNASNRVSQIFPRDCGHPLIETGLDILQRGNLSDKNRRSLILYVARTQIFLAKDLLRNGRHKEARRVLHACIDRRGSFWKWLMCYALTCVPTRVSQTVLAVLYRFYMFWNPLARTLNKLCSRSD